jgi:hypothetical protein
MWSRRAPKRRESGIIANAEKIIESAQLLRCQRGFTERVGAFVGRIEDGTPNGEHAVIPVNHHAIPLEQAHPRHLAHGRRHIADGIPDFSQRGPRSFRRSGDLGLLLLR